LRLSDVLTFAGKKLQNDLRPFWLKWIDRAPGGKSEWKANTQFAKGGGLARWLQPPREKKAPQAQVLKPPSCQAKTHD
jgi:hypothetical protein